MSQLALDGTRSDYVLTAQVGTNAALFADAARLYLKPGWRVADVTYGKGVFWQQIDSSQYDLLATDLATGVDFRQLPYEAFSLDAVVLDPPYIYNPKDTVKDSISEPYKVNTTGLSLTTIDAVIGLYKDGISEALRVLRRPGGRLFVKCQDQIQAGKQRWVHIELFDFARSVGLYARDLLVLVQKTRPAIRWPVQKHARKNHSYLWVFEA